MQLSETKLYYSLFNLNDTNMKRNSFFFSLTLIITLIFFSVYFSLEKQISLMIESDSLNYVDANFGEGDRK